MTPAEIHSYLEPQQHKRTCKLTCYKSKFSFQNYGILAHVVCILSSINNKNLQLFHSSKQKKSAPSSFHNETFNVRALELKAYALDRNFERLEANLL